MFVLETERNAQGKLVFSKEKVGKKVFYLAKDERDNVVTVDSEWVWEHEYDIANLGVSGSHFYPVKLSKHFLKCEACGKPFSTDDRRSLYSKDTLYDIDICPHCYENGCRVGSEYYFVCMGCGEYSDHCWVKASDCVSDVDGGSMCKEIAEGSGWGYCENCNMYYNPYYDNCPKCSSDNN